MQVKLTFLSGYSIMSRLPERQNRGQGNEPIDSSKPPRILMMRPGFVDTQRVMRAFLLDPTSLIAATPIDGEDAATIGTVVPHYNEVEHAFTDSRWS